MQYLQLELIEEPIEVTLSREVAMLRDQTERVRKGQYARIGQLQKMYDELKRDHEYLKVALCTSKAL